MRAVLCIVLGYLVGTVNPSYIVGKARGVDVKKEGSKNAGASNAVLLMGKAVGIICGLIDIFKAFVIYKICEALFPGMEAAGILAGAGCMLGHIFPVWMGFRGGKGLACLGGTILAYDGKLFVLMLAAEILLALLVGYICVVAISASVIFPVIYLLRGGTWLAAGLLFAIAVVVLIKHQENLQRIAAGSEIRVSYLWNKAGEVERLRDKYPE